MDTINNDITNLLQQMGVHKESLGITQRIVIIAGILIIAFVADYFCRKIIVPTIKKLTARTQATWDDYLFNDAVLDNMCHLIPPIILYVLLPFAFPHEPVTLTFILKLCWVYITAVAMKLICSFLTSLYTISSEHEKLKNHPLKGVYQMIKLIVICVGVIIIVSTLIDKDPVNILTGLGASAAILMLDFQRYDYGAGSRSPCFLPMICSVGRLDYHAEIRSGRYSNRSDSYHCKGTQLG